MADIDDEIAELRTRLAKLEAQRATQSAAPPTTAQIVDTPANDKDGVTKRLTMLIGGGLALAVVLAVLASLQPNTPTPASSRLPSMHSPSRSSPLRPASPAHRRLRHRPGPIRRTSMRCRTARRGWRASTPRTP